MPICGVRFTGSWSHEDTRKYWEQDQSESPPNVTSSAVLMSLQDTKLQRVNLLLASRRNDYSTHLLAASAEVYTGSCAQVSIALAHNTKASVYTFMLSCIWHTSMLQEHVCASGNTSVCPISEISIFKPTEGSRGSLERPVTNRKKSDLLRLDIFSSASQSHLTLSDLDHVVDE